ncbi:MAG: glycosyltransferase family 4 protein [Rhodospirillaceae bacterium]|jgi:alpha-maltose-1-phosphate synthase|nr:glycosyltransferase family 4 protein [Rhodospirillaceae bacterium]
MRILGFCHRVDHTGAPIMLYRLLSELAKRHEVELLLPTTPGEAPYLIPDYEAAGVKCIDWANMKKYDVFISNTVMSAQVILEAAGRTPILWWIHEPKSGKGMFETGMTDPAAFKCVNHVVFPTQWQAEEVYAGYLGDLSWEVVPYGLKVDTATKPRPANIPEDTFNIVQLGWFAPRKSQHVTINALGGLNNPDTHLFLLGGETTLLDYSAHCRETVAASPFLRDRVHFMGSQRAEVVNAYLQHCDLMVFPTRDDLITLSIIEAMNHERCVVSSDFGPIPETVIDGETGLLHPVGAAVVMASQIDRVIKDRDLRLRLARAGRDLVRVKHGHEAHILAMERALEKTAAMTPIKP